MFPLYTVASKDADKIYFIVAYIPAIVFWGLDSYYLLQERLYRSLYEKVRFLPEDKIDFSMKASAKEFKSKKNTFWDCFISPTECWFYLPLALLSTGIVILTYLC